MNEPEGFGRIEKKAFDPAALQWLRKRLVPGDPGHPGRGTGMFFHAVAEYYREQERGLSCHASAPSSQGMGRKNVRTNTGMSGARPLAIWHDEALSPNNQPLPIRENRQDRRARERRELKESLAAKELAFRNSRRAAKTTQPRPSEESRG